MSSLCSELKDSTISSLGELSPYVTKEIIDNQSEIKTKIVITSGRAVDYTISYNKHGAVLKSKFTKQVMYLWKDCDSYSKEYGKGSWGRANGGLLVSFDKETVGFPWQELSIEHSKECKL